MKNYRQFNEGVGENIIFHYVRMGKMKNIKEWVEGGGNINIQNDISNGNTFTPIMQNCADTQSQDVDTLSLMLYFKPDVNIKDNWGRTALWYASYNGHVDSIFLLLNAGADPFPKDITGKDFYDVLPDNGGVVKGVRDWLKKNKPVFLTSKSFDL